MKKTLLIAAGIGALSCGVVHAEGTPAPETVVKEEAITEVVVTGEKVKRSLQKTQSSVAVTTAKKIEDENIQNFYDIVRRTANMNEVGDGAGFTIRGINNQNVSGGGAGELATVYFDGTALNSQAVSTSALETWDLAQVEIFRGPQSTLQGRNALAGAVIMRSQDPTWYWDGKARVSYTDPTTRTIAIAGGGPIIEDQVAFRLSAEDHHVDGIIRNETRGDRSDRADDQVLRGKLLFKPKAFDDRFEVLLTASSNRHTGGDNLYVSTDVPDYFDHRVNYANEPSITWTNLGIFTIESKYRFNDHWTVSPVFSWSNYKYNYIYDTDRTAADGGSGEFHETQATRSQEVRLNYTGDRLNGLFGLYHFDRDIDDDGQGLTQVQLPGATLSSLLVYYYGPYGMTAPLADQVVNAYAQVMPTVPVNNRRLSPSNVETQAAFFDGSWQFLPKWTLNAGLRYDRETYKIDVVQTTSLAGDYPDPANFGAYAPYITAINQMVAAQIAQANGTTPGEPRTFTAWLPKLGIKYDFTPDMSLGFTAQRGYRSGGSTINIARSIVVPYDPEYTDNYEFAWRSAWFNRTLTLNANAYYINWTEQQVNVNLGLNTYDYQVVNAGKSHLYGFEVELAQRVNSHFNWYASVGNSRSRFDEFVVNTGTTDVDLSGSSFANAPEWSLTSGATWRFSNGVFADLNGSYRTESFGGTGVNQADDINKARTLINTKIGYEQDHWQANIFANNLFDHTYTIYNWTSEHMAMLGAPRTIGIILQAKF
jgi:outer membrane receptor protein involved in Fe transport